MKVKVEPEITIALNYQYGQIVVKTFKTKKTMHDSVKVFPLKPSQTRLRS